MMTRTMICIICPRGCTLQVHLGDTMTVTGNLCPRGAAYAMDECTHPMRTVTTTVRTACGDVVAVKTATPIPKERMMECMHALEALVVPTPVHVGDVLATDVCGAAIVATQNADAH